jgi:hypothetical protein
LLPSGFGASICCNTGFQSVAISENCTVADFWITKGFCVLVLCDNTEWVFASNDKLSAIKKYLMGQYLDNQIYDKKLKVEALISS